MGIPLFSEKPSIFHIVAFILVSVIYVLFYCAPTIASLWIYYDGLKLKDKGVYRVNPAFIGVVFLIALNIIGPISDLALQAFGLSLVYSSMDFLISMIWVIPFSIYLLFRRNRVKNSSKIIAVTK